MFSQQAWKKNILSAFVYVLMPFSLLLYHLFVGSNWMHQLALFCSPSSIIHYSFFCCSCWSLCVCILHREYVHCAIESVLLNAGINFIHAIFLRMTPQMSNAIFHQLNGKRWRDNKLYRQRYEWWAMVNMSAHGCMHRIEHKHKQWTHNKSK